MPATEKPNIVLFLTDDHGQWAGGCYGNSELATPTLDHLARTGARMDNCYTPTPVCSPGRACLFTGKLSSQHGIHDWLRERETDHRTWLDGELTLPEILDRAGYRCIFTGKWHMGGSETMRPGFHDWYSIGLPQGRHSGRHRYSDNGRIEYVEGFKTEYVTDRALDFLHQHASNEPFFLYVGYIGTHGPWTGHPERLVERYRQASFADVPAPDPHPWARERLTEHIGNRESLAQYYASVTHIDENVGRIVDRLEALGLRENTVIAYTSDHGLCCGHHGVWGKGNGTDPKNMYEESILVPMIFNHPGRIPAGVVRDDLVDHCDTFQTLLDYAGVPVPDDGRLANLPGSSYAPMLQGEEQEWRQRFFGEFGPTRCIRTPTHKYVHRYHLDPDTPDLKGLPAHDLFDLEKDPGETVNRVDDPEYAEVRSALQAELEAYFQRYEVPEKSGLQIEDHWTQGIGPEHLPLFE